ncbi:malto-oligosyltrehalose synthase [Stenotrophomonas sp. MMGLT7]|uniref:malto-oligosyltrehalose synthase n=1 Tax=Stenotrophomonas sp. MMGLT7 TaxID=2901227 RepID=UPI001E3B0684|nr:malto-oligosyltrehalose synthase [Stenotrophomonas sp. MMGLT7]MCD7098043.1 malto-oligosyltrehalose synthase [Stenotrophomonas sp. MMGLT7]
MIPLRASVRLQLHPGFTLDDAAAQVSYFARLGISHLYLSPIACAMPGSSHGYDVTDPGRVNPELGGEPALLRLSACARAHAMGLILDIVPNHMAAHPHNRWWKDVLEHGRDSRHAAWFDIDWDAPGCDGRLWLPVLDRPLASALADGVLTLRVDADGAATLLHHDLALPLRAHTLPASDPAARRADAERLNRDAARGGGELRALVARQHYRPLWWQAGSDLLNYRRFFDIAALAALRMDDADAFAAVHALPLRLVAEGHVDALRVDHVDGLADPAGYLRQLRQGLDQAGRERGLAPGSIGLYVEKILAADEVLRADWRCDGSTGYDFMDQVGGLLHDPAGEGPLAESWRARSGRSGDFEREQRLARTQMLAGPLYCDRARTLRALAAFAAGDPAAEDVSEHMLGQALDAVLKQFPVYRTYAGRDGLDAGDAARLAGACARARRGAGSRIGRAIDLLESWLRDAVADADRRRLQRRAAARVEQLSAPLNAKAVEDTAFYRHGVLLSRNEVGSDPARFAWPAAHFHDACQRRLQAHPRALLATATHDHKRGEDVRARLAVLSARAGWWCAEVDRLCAAAAALGRPLPAPGELSMLWQTLVGTWPLELQPDDAPALARYCERVAQWQLKALREARLRSSWTDPDGGYEACVQAFLEALLLSAEGLGLRRTLHAAAEAIAPAGAVNSLLQAALRMTAPGVPDLYQGREGWDFSLVDPDNRQAVDYPQRHRWLDDARPWPSLLHGWRDGAVKARLVARLLQLRARVPQLFVHGSYRPWMPALDDGNPWLLGFVREHGERTLYVALRQWPGPDAADAYPHPAQAGATLPLRREAALFHVLADAALPAAASVTLPALFAHGPLAILTDFPPGLDGDDDGR